MSKVRVILKMRPCLQACSEGSIPEMDPSVLRIVNPCKPDELLAYTFDRCYNPASSHADIFYGDALPTVSKVLDGHNAAIFAYGNTGAGKTHTMDGLIRLTVQYLLEEMAKRNSGARDVWTLRMSFLEIYCERVYDLLGTNRDIEMQIREDANRTIVIPGLTQVTLLNQNEFETAFTKGVSNRSTASTKLNARSSRSHSCLRLQVEKRTSDGSTTTTKLHLIDLAGSEDNRRADNVGDRMKESGAINKSLFVLGQVVDALNSKSIRIPYRDSKLTRLLQDSLGGNSFSLMIANIAPEPAYLNDTINTLNFAKKTKQVENRPVKAPTILLQPVAAITSMIVSSVKKLLGKPQRINPPSADKTAKTPISSISNQSPVVSSINAEPPNPFLAHDKESPVVSMQKSTRRRRKGADMEEDDDDENWHPSISVSFQETPKVKSQRGKKKVDAVAPCSAKKRAKTHMDLLMPLVETELLNVFNSGDVKKIQGLREIGKKRAQDIREFWIFHGHINRLEDLIDANVFSSKVLSKILIVRSYSEALTLSKIMSSLDPLDPRIIAQVAKLDAMVLRPAIQNRYKAEDIAHCVYLFVVDLVTELSNHKLKGSTNKCWLKDELWRKGGLIAKVLPTDAQKNSLLLTAVCLFEKSIKLLGTDPNADKIVLATATCIPAKIMYRISISNLVSKAISLLSGSYKRQLAEQALHAIKMLPSSPETVSYALDVAMNVDPDIAVAFFEKSDKLKTTREMSSFIQTLHQAIFTGADSKPSESEDAIQALLLAVPYATESEARTVLSRCHGNLQLAVSALMSFNNPKQKDSFSILSEIDKSANSVKAAPQKEYLVSESEYDDEDEIQNEHNGPDSYTTLDEFEGIDEILLGEYAKDPNAFSQNLDSKKSKSRLELIKKTGLAHEQIIGWGVMFSRNPYKEMLIQQLRYS